MNTIRERQLIKRVGDWQKSLGPLGLGHYRIEEVKIEKTPGGNPNANAAVTPSDMYDSVWFSFSIDFVDECYDNDTLEKLDQVILHEWIHVAFRDYYAAISLVEDHLSEPMKLMWEEALNTPHESLVERLARQMYHSFYSDVVP